MTNKLFNNIKSLVFDRETGDIIISDKSLAPFCGTYQFKTLVSNTVWNIKHKSGNDNASIDVLVYRDNEYISIIPDSIKIVDQNNITITFLSEESGIANIYFTCGDSIDIS